MSTSVEQTCPGWPELVTLLTLLICADAKERELYHRTQVIEPTYIGFLSYLVLTGIALGVFSRIEPLHPLHTAQLIGLCTSWILFWVFHKEKIALLFFAKTTLFCLYMLINTGNAELLLWLAYLGFNVFALWKFLQNTQSVRFPGRSFSRFRTPKDHPPSNANSFLINPQNTVLVTQEMSSNS